MEGKRRGRVKKILEMIDTKDEDEDPAKKKKERERQFSNIFKHIHIPHTYSSVLIGVTVNTDQNGNI